MSQSKKKDSIAIAKIAASKSVPFDAEKVLKIADLKNLPVESEAKPETEPKPKKNRRQRASGKKRRARRAKRAKTAGRPNVNNVIKNEVSKIDAKPVKTRQRRKKKKKNEGKNEVIKPVEIDEFAPPEGVPKRVAWRRWKKDIDDKFLSKGQVVIIKNLDGTTETLTPNDTLENLDKEKQEVLVTKLANKAAKKERKREALEKKLNEIKHIDAPEEDFESFIEIAVSCSWYQKRLSWMLSSVLNQKGDVPKIVFNVAYPKDNGDPTTGQVCKFFREKGLNIKETVYNDFSIIQFRG